MDKPITSDSFHSEATQPVERDLLICIDKEWSFEYKGTRAQLEDEGIIPADTEWPEFGKYSVYWHADGLMFDLRRCRPDGLKGPMRLWLGGDYWCLRVTRSDRECRAIRSKARELKELLYRNSEEGTRRWRETWAAAERSRNDEAFQAFRAKIPALAELERRRGRKPKTSAEARDE